MGSLKYPHVFDPLDIEIIDRVYEARMGACGSSKPIPQCRQWRRTARSTTQICDDLCCWR